MKSFLIRSEFLLVIPKNLPLLFLRVIQIINHSAPHIHHEVNTIDFLSHHNFINSNCFALNCQIIQYEEVFLYFHYSTLIALIEIFHHVNRFRTPVGKGMDKDRGKVYFKMDEFEDSDFIKKGVKDMESRGNQVEDNNMEEEGAESFLEELK